MKSLLTTCFFLFSLMFFSACDQEEEQVEEVQEELEEEVIACNGGTDQSAQAVPGGEFDAKFTSTPLVIDGCSKDAMWADATWYDLNYTWMGNPPAASDYKGRFKALWDANYLYLFVEVADDSLHATLTDGIDNYWKGDYVEVFLDEDQSGGNHQYNHQAFAYHVSTEGHAIDKNTKQETAFFDEHVEVARTREGNTHFWEMAIAIYDNSFDEEVATNTPITLSPAKVLGFSLAYGDNDGNQSRENFMGSRQTHGANNDEGYINSDVFGAITLVE